MTFNVAFNLSKMATKATNKVAEAANNMTYGEDKPDSSIALPDLSKMVKKATNKVAEAAKNMAYGEDKPDPSIALPDDGISPHLRIACPVLAALVKKGTLVPDGQGRVEMWQLFYALRKVGSSDENSLFQALGIAAYRRDDPLQEDRNRMGTVKTRYLNIYRMNASDATIMANIHQVQHGFSTTIRNTLYDPVDPSSGNTAVTDEDIKKSRRERLHDWLGLGKSNDQKWGRDQLLVLFGKMKCRGDRSSEWSAGLIQKYHEKAYEHSEYPDILEEWQPMLAWTGFMLAFGRKTFGDDSDGGLYMTQDDLEKLFLESEFPDDWNTEGRPLKKWGFKRSANYISTYMLTEMPTEPVLAGIGAIEHGTAVTVPVFAHDVAKLRFPAELKRQFTKPFLANEKAAAGRMLHLFVQIGVFADDDFVKIFFGLQDQPIERSCRSLPDSMSSSHAASTSSNVDTGSST